MNSNKNGFKKVRITVRFFTSFQAEFLNQLKKADEILSWKRVSTNQLDAEATDSAITSLFNKKWSHGRKNPKSWVSEIRLV